MFLYVECRTIAFLNLILVHYIFETYIILFSKYNDGSNGILFVCFAVILINGNNFATNEIIFH